MPLRLKWIVGGARWLKSNDRSESEMIKIENVEVYGWEAAIRGMRSPLNSWEKSDSYQGCDAGDCENCEEISKFCAFGSEYVIGENDLALMRKLAAAGSVHGKYRRMITVTLDITAPLYWWKEFDTYKVGTVRNSCSTMHKITAKRFEREDFSIEHLLNCGEGHWVVQIDNIICACNVARERYLETKDKKYWWQIIQLLPSSYNQRATVQLNYEVLAGMYHYRNDHKLDEWQEFCRWIESLPYSELITGKES